MGSMVKLLRALVFGLLVNGCMPPPQAPDIQCCAAPAPGTARLHLGGQLGVGIGFSR
jgi:hypothetical protein